MVLVKIGMHNIGILMYIQNVTVGLYRKLSAEGFMLLNCGVGEDS